jgi:hypothetical protein
MFIAYVIWPKESKALNGFELFQDELKKNTPQNHFEINLIERKN